MDKGITARVSKRYNEFKALNEAIILRYGGLDLPPFPSST